MSDLTALTAAVDQSVLSTAKLVAEVATLTAANTTLTTTNADLVTKSTADDAKIAELTAKLVAGEATVPK